VSYVRTLYKELESRRQPDAAAITNCTASWAAAAPGSLLYVKKWNGLPPKLVLKFVATSAVRGKTLLPEKPGGRRPDAKIYYRMAFNPAETTGYLCGHPSISKNGRGILERAGWQRGSTFEEVYFHSGKKFTTE